MSFIQYLKDTRAELRHVAWPTRTQTAVFTGLVVAISIFISLYLGVFDYLFTGVMERVISGTSGISLDVPQASSTSAITITPVSTSTGLPSNQ